MKKTNKNPLVSTFFSIVVHASLSLLFTMKRSFAQVQDILSCDDKPPDANNKRQCSPELADAVFSCPELARHILTSIGDAHSFKALAATNTTCRAIAAMPSVQLSAKNSYATPFHIDADIVDGIGRCGTVYRLPNGKPHGLFSLHKIKYGEPVVKTGRFVDGRREGEWTVTSFKGVLLKKSMFVNDLLHGTRRQWYDSGTIKAEETYSNGELHGRSETYWMNGQKKGELTYHNGKAHGLETVWSQSGPKFRETTYVHGKEEGLCTQWHWHGGKAVECTFINGKREGLETAWYYSGAKQSECTFVGGYKEGIQTQWYQCGIKKCEYTCYRGMVHGIYTKWYSSGRFKKCEFYAHGNLSLCFRESGEEILSTADAHRILTRRLECCKKLLEDVDAQLQNK